MGRTHNGKPRKILTIIDEYSRQCLALIIARSIKSDDVLDCLSSLFLVHGVPENIGSDNGPEFAAGLSVLVSKQPLSSVEVRGKSVIMGAPIENSEASCSIEKYYTIKEAWVLIENWLREYNTISPHSGLDHKPPAPEAVKSLIFEPF